MDKRCDPCCGSRGRCLKTNGIILGGLGVFFILFGIFFSHLILLEFQHQLHHTLRLQTPESDKKLYDDWKNSDYDGAVESSFSFYFNNLTNLDEVIKGAVPHVEERGPYVYRYYRERFNISFNDSDNVVKYNSRTSFTFSKELSCDTCTPDDQILGLWATMVTLVKSAGGIVNVPAIPTSQMINLIMTTLLEVSKKYGNCLSDKNCEMMALGQWLNSAGIPGVVAPGQSIVNSDVYLTHIKNTKRRVFAGIIEFFRQSKLSLEFGLNNKQPNTTLTLDQMYKWTFDAKDNKNLFTCGLLDVATTIDKDMGCATLFIQDDMTSLSPLFNGIGTMNNKNALLAYFYAGLGVPTISALASLGGSAMAGSMATGNFGGNFFLSKTVNQWTFELDDPFARLVVEGMGLVGPALESSTIRHKVNTAFFANHNTSSIDESWDTSKSFSAVKTGRANVNEIRSMVEFDSQKILPQNVAPGHAEGYFCGSSVEVYGNADAQPFAPGTAGWFHWHSSMSNDKKTHVWVDDTLRPVLFQYHEDRKYRGISVKRYEIADSEFLARPEFDVKVPGLLNMTCPRHNAPVFLTLPHYARADITNDMKVDGVSEPIPEEHYSFLDIEPNTGSTLIGYKRLQINLEIDPSWLSPQTSRKTMTYYPSLWVMDCSHMSDKQEHMFKSQILGALMLHKVVLITCLTLGTIFSVAGPIIYYVGGRKVSMEENLGDYNMLAPKVDENSQPTS